MADSSNLDDFFAKKDKNKKTKKKNISTEEMAKKLEESGKRNEKTRKPKDKTNTSALITNIADQVDEEWNDFEEEREKDYSGLKIQTLVIKDKEEELREQQLQEMEEEKQKESSSGPWRKSAGVDKSDNDSDNERGIPEEPTKRVPQPPPQPSDQSATKYVPPHLRNQPQTQSSSTSPMSPMTPVSLASTRRKAGAPKIGDIVEFPSLGAMDSNEDLKGYQTVKHGARELSPSRKSPNVALDNKYGILQNND